MDIYFRNPDYYIKECIEANVNRFSWDLGHTKRRGISILKWSKLFLDNIPDWKMIVLAVEGTAEYSINSKSIDKPDAVYPSWRMDDGWDALENYCSKPAGEDLFLCLANDIELQFRPVRGQAHKVVIYDCPNPKSYEGNAQLRMILDIKKKYPKVEFIIHNTASFRIMFAMKFEGACFDPSVTAKRGSIIAPSGAALPSTLWFKNKNWIHALGYSLDFVRESIHNRILYNIESSRWASENYNKNVNFRLRATNGLDIETKRGAYEYAEIQEAWLTKPVSQSSMLSQPGDGIVCNSCSLSSKCKFFREGMVCSVPGSESANLSKMFGTRDAETIIDGLVELTKIQSERLQLDLKQEADTEERDYMTDKRLKDLFDSGVKVAKLINPKLAGGGQTVNIGVAGGATIVAAQTPQELMSSAVRALEAQGIPREDITTEMIRGLLEGMANKSSVQKTIEQEAKDSGHSVIEHKDS